MTNNQILFLEKEKFFSDKNKDAVEKQPPILFDHKTDISSCYKIWIDDLRYPDESICFDAVCINTNDVINIIKNVKNKNFYLDMDYMNNDYYMQSYGGDFSHILIILRHLCRHEESFKNIYFYVHFHTCRKEAAIFMESLIKNNKNFIIS